MSTPPGPFFKNAPVVERVLGIQFDPIPGFHIGLLGAFWQCLGDDWTHVTDAPPIEPQFERFGENAVFAFPFPGAVSIRLSQAPACRLQILNQAKDRMIQVQNGRFHLNWKGASGPDYPRYHELRREFRDYLGRFQAFLATKVEANLRPNQWEVTYLNHVPKGPVWQAPADWHSLFPPLHVLPPVVVTASLETMGGQWQYEIRPQRGRLHVELRHGRQEHPTPTEVLVFNLTARGPIDSVDESGILAGIDLGHETIVHAFKECTSSSAHIHWELQDETT